MNCTHTDDEFRSFLTDDEYEWAMAMREQDEEEKEEQRKGRSEARERARLERLEANTQTRNTREEKYLKDMAQFDLEEDERGAARLGLSVSDYRDKQLEDLLEDQRWRAMSRSERLKCVRVEKMSKGDLQKRFEEFNGSCAYCGDPLSRGRYLDHVVPIFRKGNDTLDNVVYTCHPCNQSKGASNPLDWYRDKPFWTQEKEDKIIAVTGKLCTTMELIFGGG